MLKRKIMFDVSGSENEDDDIKKQPVAKKPFQLRKEVENLANCVKSKSIVESETEELTESGNNNESESKTEELTESENNDQSESDEEWSTKNKKSETNLTEAFKSRKKTKSNNKNIQNNNDSDKENTNKITKKPLTETNQNDDLSDKKDLTSVLKKKTLSTKNVMSIIEDTDSEGESGSEEESESEESESEESEESEEDLGSGKDSEGDEEEPEIDAFSDSEEKVTSSKIKQKLKSSKIKKKAVDDDRFKSEHESESDDNYEIDSDKENDKGDKRGEQKLVANVDKNEILKFFNECSLIEMNSLPSSKIAIKPTWEIMVTERPFKDYDELCMKVKSQTIHKYVKENLVSRKLVNDLMIKCKDMSSYVKRRVDTLIENQEDSKNNSELRKQPQVLNKNMKLKPYQIIGLNWLILMYKQNLNAILADEMGLGKTCQTIAFLAYLYERNEKLLHLIVVPASTLDNWAKELRAWFPKFKFEIYRGSIDERLALKKKIIKLQKQKRLNAVLTTYSFVSNKRDDDRSLFQCHLKIDYCVLDEAHMLRNMNTFMYKNLMQIKSKKKLLLTGTPLQNNMVELMSLLYFVMPNYFSKHRNLINKLFFQGKHLKDSSLDGFYNEKVTQARGIMNTFILRRLKSVVLKELPEKANQVVRCEMSIKQKKDYDLLTEQYKKSETKLTSGTMLKAMMEMRMGANHPLLRRTIYTEEMIKEMAGHIMKVSSENTRFDYVVEDLLVCNDFELHNHCPLYPGLSGYQLTDEIILESGKFKEMDRLLEEFKQNGDRVLIFSQFITMLNIIEKYLQIRGHKYQRLDGSTKVTERQGLIDEFNDKKDIFVFTLSTKAGGVGINLTGANKVIIHDLDFNPQNDKQAEDRCHRVGQTKQVEVFKLISNGTIDELILKSQNMKLKLEEDMSKEESSKTQIMKMFNDLFNN